MGQDVFEISINLIKLLLIFLAMVQAVPLLVWVERRGSAFIQHRFGPNRVGPLGLLQLLADAVKFIFKEEFRPKESSTFLYYAAPVAALIPAALALAAIPLAPDLALGQFEMFGKTWGPYSIDMQGVHIQVGIIYILGVSSLGTYGILMAGWGSANKFSLMGALRASAQMISYELALGLSVVAVVLIYGTFDLNKMILLQEGLLSFSFMGQQYAISWLPNWGIFFQPLGFILFFCAVFAETNRLPFDLVESEAELVAGFHTEYGGFKMLLFFIGEYGHMIVASSLATIFFFGGYHIPYVSVQQVQDCVNSLVGMGNLANILTSLVFLLSFLIKIAIFLWIFVWVRWTLPRFRYDHLMDLGWKTMLPWALANMVITATIILIAKSF